MRVDMSAPVRVSKERPPMSEHEPDDQRYIVVMNHEEQYSIWPSGKAIPLGWTSIKFEGAKEDCLQHIEQVWTNMLPRSVRLQLEKH
jgi:MbtH protein